MGGSNRIEEADEDCPSEEDGLWHCGSWNAREPALNQLPPNSEFLLTTLTVFVEDRSRCLGCSDESAMLETLPRTNTTAQCCLPHKFVEIKNLVAQPGLVGRVFMFQKCFL
jgi:hypothetical protein